MSLNSKIQFNLKFKEVATSDRLCIIYTIINLDMAGIFLRIEYLDVSFISKIQFNLKFKEVATTSHRLCIIIYNHKSRHGWYFS